MPRRGEGGRRKRPVLNTATVRELPKAPKKRKAIEYLPPGTSLAVRFARGAGAAYQGPFAPKGKLPSTKRTYRGSSKPLSGTQFVRALPKAGSGSKATSGTVPAHAKAPTPRNPRSTGGVSVTRKAQLQARGGGAARPGAGRRTGRVGLPLDPYARGFSPNNQDEITGRNVRPSARVQPGSGAQGEADLSDLSPREQARRLAEAEFAPTLSGYDLESRQAAEAAAERQRAVQGLTVALMRELGGMPAGVAGDYAAATRATEGLAAGAAAELRGEGSAAGQRLAADLAAIGAPAEAGAASQAMVGDVFGGGAGALYYTGGTSPAELLAGEGARETAFTRQLPAFAALSGQQNMRQALYERERQRQEIASRRGATLREMGARIPMYQRDIEKEEQRQREAAADLALKQKAADLNARLAAKTFGLKVQGQQFGQQATTQRLQNERARIRLQAITADRSWNATLRRLGISDAGLKLRAADLEFKFQNKGRRGGFTPYQAQRLANQAADTAGDFYNGVQDKDGNVLQAPLGEDPNDYQQAMSDLLSRGIPLSLAQRALNRWWRTPGKYGRPKVPFQLRQQRTT